MGGDVAAHSLPSFNAVEAVLGETVLYHAATQDDAAEVVSFPLSADVDVFAAIVTRVHPRGMVDLMVLDPSKGPMPRWKVPYAEHTQPGHWSFRDRVPRRPHRPR
jgi:hypothetical protein